MSKSAEQIDDALKLYRDCEGTPDEQVAYENIQSTVQRVKKAECCGGRCRWCTEWRKP
jgi:hypothetical protein